MGPNGNGAKSDSRGAGWVPRRQKLEKVVIRFAGDSGDGMQLTGDRFTSEAALFGNDLATQPNYPAEIRAPQGTLPGVSSFQIQIADYDILTAGDRPDVLVAMNPAALKANIGDLPRGGVVIANSDEFTKRNLAKVGYDGSPLDTDELSDYFVHAIPMTTLTLGAVESIGASKKDGQRAKNMFALGLLSWMYGREIEPQETFIREKFIRKPDIAEANVLALRAGWNYGETTEAFGTTYEVSPAKLQPGEYRQVSGNTALAYGIVVAGQLADTQVVLGSYPITPASDILHELSKNKHFNVVTFQAEDEIAGIGVALGASYGGALGVTSTSGPGISLKSEAIGLGVMVELPLLVIDVQRGGPSTGLPTKTEQADLLQALYGRNGECPLAVLAPRSPSDCFETAVEAVRIALTYRTPVILLSDGAIANGSEPWRIPDVSSFEPIDRALAQPGEDFQPYARDPQTLARQFAIPGTPGLEHRLGGLEKANGTGNISYEPDNHDLMVRLRQAKIDGIPVPDVQVDDPSGEAELLLVGWGSSYGPIGEACRRARRRGIKVARAHLRHLNPLPANLGDVLGRYRTVVAPEMNLGQLAFLLRGKYLVDVRSVTKVAGMAFLADEVEGIIDAALAGTLVDNERDKATFARLAAAGITGSRSKCMTEVTGVDLGLTAISGVPTTDEPQKAKDFTSDQEVRWCPGCGDYVILNTIRNFLPELGLRRENMVFVSGIGCSSRFPYYLETYGIHSIHGRAPTLATGLAVAREDLSVWVVTGDGDALSIGGNHLIHALRRNVNITILLFNNRIYGLTKGQYSPTSEVGKVTKSTPMGSLDFPFNPVSLGLGAEASFVGRALDSDRKGLSEVLRAAAQHRGAALVEILQDCPIFNDGSFDVLRKDGADERVITVHQGEPITFGNNGEYCVVRSGFGLEVAKTADVAAGEIVVHDATVDDPAYSFALSRLSEQNLEHTVMGVFRQVQRPTYDDAARAQVRTAMKSTPHDRTALQALLRGRDTWTVN